MYHLSTVKIGLQMLVILKEADIVMLAVANVSLDTLATHYMNHISLWDSTDRYYTLVYVLCLYIYIPPRPQSS